VIQSYLNPLILRAHFRHRFGRRAETLLTEQMQLGEQVAASSEARQDDSAPEGRTAWARKRRAKRG
jgi:hypothetical protein